MLHRIKGPWSIHDGLTAIAVDKDQNILVGGHFAGPLFLDDPTVLVMNPIFNLGIPDFFMAKFAAWNCNENPYIGTVDLKREEQVFLYPNPTSDYVFWKSDRV